jgi:hypothetical protein
MTPAFSFLTALWSMCAAACLMFAGAHLMLWLRGRRKTQYLLTTVMATAAGYFRKPIDDQALTGAIAGLLMISGKRI